MKVFFHTKDSESADWENVELEFAQIPALGEHVALSTSSDYYRVTLVVYCPFAESSYAAEVYAVKDGDQITLVGQAGENFEKRQRAGYLGIHSANM